MLAAVTDNQDQGTPFRISLAKHGAETARLFGTAQKASRFKLRR